MRILDLKRLKKHLVQVDFEELSIQIDEETYASEKLSVGQDLSDTQIETLQYKSDFVRAKNKGLFFLSRRDYSKKELFNKLKPDFNQEAIKDALNLLESIDLLNDERYARIKAADLVALKGLSKRGILYELSSKGIDKELALLVVEDLVDDEENQIAQLITQKYYRYLDDEKLKKKMFAALLRKGYSYSQINKAINSYNNGEF